MKNNVVSILMVAFLTLFASIFGNRIQATPLNQIPFRIAALSDANSVLLSSQIPLVNTAISTLRHSSHDILVAGQEPVSFIIKEAPYKNKAITNFLFDFSQQPYWLRLANTQSQSLILYRVTSETKASEAFHHKLARLLKQFEFTLPVSCSRNLLEGLPPGFFLLI